MLDRLEGDESVIDEGPTPPAANVSRIRLCTLERKASPKVIKRHDWRPDERADGYDDDISLNDYLYEEKGGQSPVPTVDGEEPQE